MIRGRLGVAGAVVAVVAVVTAALTGCGAPAVQPAATVGSFTDGGVAVAFRWSRQGDDRPVLAVTFSPVDQGFHLYSTDLPAAGVDGVGRPTVVQVGGALSAAGRSTADRTPIWLQVAGVAAPVPVYPDGPVTLRVPAAVGSGGRAEAWVTYAACSSTICRPPVSRRQVWLTIPGVP